VGVGGIGSSAQGGSIEKRRGGILIKGEKKDRRNLRAIATAVREGKKKHYSRRGENVTLIIMNVRKS